MPRSYSPRGLMFDLAIFFSKLGACTVLNCRSICLGILLACVGCGSPTAHLSKPAAVVTWPALKALQDPEVARSVIMPAHMGDVTGRQKGASDPKLAELLAKFEAEPIPSQFKSPAREAAKTKAVEAYKAVIEGAKGTPTPQAMKDAVTAMTTAIGTLTDPTLK